MSPKSDASTRTAMAGKPAAGGFHQVLRTAGSGQRAADRAHRAARLPNFIGLSAAAETAFDDLQLAVIGAGSVGRRIALSAARLQPRTLWIVDPARYKPESLLTQEILPGDVGDAKASNTGRACKSISPGTRVLVYDGPVQELPRTAFLEATLVVMAPDNLAAETDVGQRCLHLGKPLVHASLHGESMVAQVRFFGNTRNQAGAAAGPCPACGYGTREWSELSAETVYSCGGAQTGSETAAKPEKRPASPTMSTSFLSALPADFAWVQITRYLLALGKSPLDGMLHYCGYTHESHVTPLRRNPDCACEHIVWQPAPAPRPLPECTLGELVRSAGIEPAHSGTRLAFEVDDFPFVEAAWCCGQLQPVGRFKHAGLPSPDCRHCSRPLVFDPFYEHASVPAASIAWDRPLGKLGAEAARFVVVRASERATLFVNREDMP